MNQIRLFVLCFSLCLSLQAQVDTTRAVQDSTFNRIDLDILDQEKLGLTATSGRTWLRRNPYKAIVTPIVLVGVGAILIKNPLYDRFDFRTDLRNTFRNFRGSRIDDFLIYTPYVGLVALNLFKIPCQNDFINTSLIIVKAEIINLALTFGLKYITNIERPNGKGLAWPSGHTSEAFLAATIVNREYRYKHPWVGFAAYGVAGTVGLFRMLNNKHWLSDVVAGAGIGIFSANLTYITHKWKWGRPGTCFVPVITNGKPGFAFSHTF